MADDIKITITGDSDDLVKELGKSARALSQFERASRQVAKLTKQAMEKAEKATKELRKETEKLRRAQEKQSADKLARRIAVYNLIAQKGTQIIEAFAKAVDKSAERLKKQGQSYAEARDQIIKSSSSYEGQQRALSNLNDQYADNIKQLSQYAKELDEFEKEHGNAIDNVGGKWLKFQADMSLIADGVIDSINKMGGGAQDAVGVEGVKAADSAWTKLVKTLERSIPFYGAVSSAGDVLRKSQEKSTAVIEAEAKAIAKKNEALRIEIFETDKALAHNKRVEADRKKRVEEGIKEFERLKKFDEDMEIANLQEGINEAADKRIKRDKSNEELQAIRFRNEFAVPGDNRGAINAAAANFGGFDKKENRASEMIGLTDLGRRLNTSRSTKDPAKIAEEQRALLQKIEQNGNDLGKALGGILNKLTETIGLG